MGLAELKAEVIQLVQNAEDEVTLRTVREVFKNEEDWYDLLPLHVQQSIERGLAQSERGEGISNEEALAKFRAWVRR